MDVQAAQEMGARMLEGQFDLDDFLKQMKQIKKMGSLTSLIGMVPGMNRLKNEIDEDELNQQLKFTEAIISSMTLEERRNPRVLNASRKRRIAKGSGSNVQDVNQLIHQFREMQKMMSQLKTPRGLSNLMNMFR